MTARPKITYRGYRRNVARALKLVWRALKRVRHPRDGNVVVSVPFYGATPPPTGKSPVIEISDLSS